MAMRSLTDFAGNDSFTTSISGVYAAMTTGVKSFTES